MQDAADAPSASLQNKLRRDPPSYRDDFLSQYHQYETFRDLFLQNPATPDDAGLVSLRALIDFVAHVADCYPAATAQFPRDVAHMLSLHHDALEPELRDKLVGSLVLLRNRDVIDSST